MKKIKFVALSAVAAMTMGFTGQVSNVQASEALQPQAVTQAADSIWISRFETFTTVSSMWHSTVMNGKRYSGYLYNQGVVTVNGKTKSHFMGALFVGPYAPNVHNPER